MNWTTRLLTAALLLCWVSIPAGGCSSTVNEPTSRSDAQEAAPDHSDAMPETEPVPEPNTFDLSSSRFTNVFTFEDEAGYTCTIEVASWLPVEYPEDAMLEHPDRADFMLDSAAMALDSTRDTVVPYCVTMTNTTEGYPIAPLSFRYHAIDAAIGTWYFNDVYETPNKKNWPQLSDDRILLNVVLDGSGPKEYEYTVSPSDWSFFVAGGPITWTMSEPLQPGAEVKVFGFYIYRDHTTPNEPSGSRWVVNRMALGAEFTERFVSTGYQYEWVTFDGTLVPE